MLYSKRRKNLGGGRRKRSNRRSYGTRMRGGVYVEKWETVYSKKFPETIKDIIKYPNNYACFGCSSPSGPIHNKEDFKKYLKDASGLYTNLQKALGIHPNTANSYDQSVDEICDTLDAIVAAKQD